MPDTSLFKIQKKEKMKPLRTYISLIISLFITISGYAQSSCFDLLNAHDFFASGGAEADWQIIDDSTILQEWENHPPSFYLYPQKFIDVEFQCEITVNSLRDFDYAGIVFGLKSPISIGDSNYNFYLFDWKGKTGYFHGYQGHGGYSVCKASGVFSEEDSWKCFYGHQKEEGKFEVLHTNFQPGSQWESFTTYTIKVKYHHNNISISINNTEIFSKNGCFEPGYIGFYSFSQPHIRFRGAKIISDAFIYLDKRTICRGNPIQFSSIDSACHQENSWNTNYYWTFGTQDTNFNRSGSYTYQDNGDHPIFLHVQTKGGCQFTKARGISVLNSPDVYLGPDTILYPNKEILLNAFENNCTYRWNTGAISPEIIVNQAGTYWVEVNNGSCSSADSVQVKKLIISQFGLPTAFSPNNDLINDSLKFMGNLTHLKAFSIIIFDRTGSIVFESTASDFAWDGRFQGNQLPTGIYFYQLSYRTIAEKTYSGKGQIMILP